MRYVMDELMAKDGRYAAQLRAGELTKSPTEISA